MSKLLNCIAVSLLILSGCSGTEQTVEKPKPEKKKSILKQRTQDIGKFDPDAGRRISDGKIQATDPLTAPLAAYGPMAGQVSQLAIDKQIGLYVAEHGRFPTYEEFMSDIVKKHNMRLPVLPYKMEYQYDEQNHKLVIVYPQDGDDRIEGKKKE